jgi:hypothetical protein
MKLNYDYEKPDCDRCEYREPRKPDYDKCDYREPKKHDYYEYEKCCDDHKFAKCQPKNPCPYPIIFECAQGTSVTIPGVAALADTTPFTPRPLGCLTIDTTCLKMPVVKFDFTAIVKYIAVADNYPARLTFALCKQCDNGEEICCGTWDFAVDFDANLEQITTSFSFSHCECNSCPGCCTYTVKIIAATNVGVNNILDVFNPALQAFAKSNC